MIEDQLLSMSSKYLESLEAFFYGFITIPDELARLESMLLFDFTEGLRLSSYVKKLNKCEILTTIMLLKLMAILDQIGDTQKSHL